MEEWIAAPAYDPARERAWHLSLLRAPGLNAWCAHDRGTGACVAFGADERATDGPRPPERPAGVSFIALPETSVLVPEAALALGSEMSHLRAAHGSAPTGLLRDEPIEAIGARCLYLHDEQAEHTLLTRWPGARSLPLQGVLLNLALAKSGAGRTALLHMSAKRLDLVIAEDQRLLLSNTFHTVGAEDVLYFTLFALERTGSDAERTRALLAGTHLTDAHEALLARYLPEPRPAIGRNDAPFAAINIAAPHRWTALLHQFACAS